jgi:hypothetical protein
VIGAWLWTRPPEPEGLDGVLRDLGFFPITPPNVLTGIGSLYHVTDYGRRYTPVCRVSKEFTWPSSTLEEIAARRLLNASYGLKSGIANRIKVELNDSNIQDISYSLTEVSVSEASLGELREIAKKLVERPSCKAELDALVNAGEFVCQGVTVLKATSEYRLKYASDQGITSMVDEVKGRKITDVIKANLSADAEVNGGKIRSGVQLHYGIRLHPRCIVPKDAKRIVNLPESDFWWYLHDIRTFFRSRLSI